MYLYRNTARSVSLHCERLTPGESRFGLYTDLVPIPQYGASRYVMLHCGLFAFRLFWHRYE